MRFRSGVSNKAGCARTSSTSFTTRRGEDSTETSVLWDDDEDAMVESESEKSKADEEEVKDGKLEVEERAAQNAFTGSETERESLRCGATTCDSSK